MDKLLRVIQKINKNQMGAIDSCDYVIGTVVGINPLKVQISDRIILEEDMLLLTETVVEKKLNLKHTHPSVGTALETIIVIQEAIKIGDKLHLLKVSGGQLFIVLSKLRDKKSVVITKDNQWNWT